MCSIVRLKILRREFDQLIDDNIHSSFRSEYKVNEAFSALKFIDETGTPFHFAIGDRIQRPEGPLDDEEHLHEVRYRLRNATCKKERRNPYVTSIGE